MASNTSGNISASLMKQYWIPGFLSELRSQLQFKPLGKMGKVPAGEGQIVHWLSMADLAIHTTQASEASDPNS